MTFFFYKHVIIPDIMLTTEMKCFMLNKLCSVWKWKSPEIQKQTSGNEQNNLWRLYVSNFRQIILLIGITRESEFNLNIRYIETLKSLQGQNFIWRLHNQCQPSCQTIKIACARNSNAMVKHGIKWTSIKLKLVKWNRYKHWYNSKRYLNIEQQIYDYSLHKVQISAV